MAAAKTRERSELRMDFPSPLLLSAVAEPELLGRDMLDAMAFLRSIYDGAELVAVQTDVEVTREARRYSTVTALARVQRGVVHDYVAIKGQPGYRSATIYEHLVAWERRDGGYVQRDYEPEDFTHLLDDVFPWGRILAVHRVNGYVVVEQDGDGDPDFTTQMLDGHRLGYHSWGSLDLALLYLMAARARFETMDSQKAWSAAANSVPTELAFIARGLRLEGYR